MSQYIYKQKKMLPLALFHYKLENRLDLLRAVPFCGHGASQEGSTYNVPNLINSDVIEFKIFCGLPYCGTRLRKRAY